MFTINGYTFSGLSRTHRTILRTLYRQHLAYRQRTGYDRAKGEAKADLVHSLRARGFKYTRKEQS